MSPQQAERLTRTIRDRVEKHDVTGMTQWYVDELVIDCDADEFWKVVEHALIEAEAGG